MVTYRFGLIHMIITRFRLAQMVVSGLRLINLMIWDLFGLGPINKSLQLKLILVLLPPPDILPQLHLQPPHPPLTILKPLQGFLVISLHKYLHQLLNKDRLLKTNKTRSKEMLYLISQ